MANVKDLTGKKFGNLTVLSIFDRKGKSKRVRWLCLCDCGKKVPVFGCNLTKGNSTKCSECGQKRSHGLSATKLYRVWGGMKSRCNNQKDEAYHNYGGKGIRVCDEWNNDYVVFNEWAKSNGYKSGLTIERKDCNGNYCPENCTWIPKSDQSNNTSRSIRIEFEGKIMTLKDWSVHLNVPYARIQSRIKQRGWSIEKTFKTPLVDPTRRNVRLIECGENIFNLRELGDITGLGFRKLSKLLNSDAELFKREVQSLTGKPVYVAG